MFIYGDVLARNGITQSTDLICGGSELGRIEGAVITQNSADSRQWGKTTIVVPDQSKTNFGGTLTPPATNPTLITNSVNLKWTKPL